MKNLRFVLIGILFCWKMGAQNDRHVLLISIDGFRPDFYMNNDWNTPNLKSLMKEGIYANGINSVFPSVTYPSHTTIITGAYPARHGIFYNVPRSSRNHHWNWESSSIKTRTLWDAAKKKGLETGAVMWPVSIGAPITYNFPVRRPDDSEEGSQLSVTEPLVTPKGLISEMRAAGVVKSKDQFEHKEIDHTIGSMARYILKNHKPSLMAVHFLGADHNEHRYGREDIHVHKAVEEIDHEIGQLLQLLQEEGMMENTTVIVTGDHGFVDVSRVFSPNVLLEKMGLLSEKSWKAKFTTAGGSAFLYLKDKKYLPQIEEMLATLPEEQKEVFTVYDRMELDKVGADPKAALALGLKKGVSASAGSKGPVLKDRKPGGTHGYFPDFKEIQTGFIICGAGIRPHAEVTGMGIKDIAPIISAILDLDFDAKDGELPGKILKKK